ncbi:membrane protein insertion efficiency factor YidD [Gimesia benthica]
MKRIEIQGDSYECDVNPIHIPTIERILKGTTESDTSIQAMSIPRRPLRLFLAIKSLRWYRKYISPKIGSRCVFEPSCSHYAELAFRKKGMIKGMVLTIRRLLRCRPGNGGVDLP